MLDKRKIELEHSSKCLSYTKEIELINYANIRKILC